MCERETQVVPLPRCSERTGEDAKVFLIHDKGIVLGQLKTNGGCCSHYLKRPKSKMGKKWFYRLMENSTTLNIKDSQQKASIHKVIFLYFTHQRLVANLTIYWTNNRFKKSTLLYLNQQLNSVWARYSNPCFNLPHALQKTHAGKHCIQCCLSRVQVNTLKLYFKVLFYTQYVNTLILNYIAQISFENVRLHITRS